MGSGDFTLAASKGIDSGLAALFSNSAGPVKKPTKQQSDSQRRDTETKHEAPLESDESGSDSKGSEEAESDIELDEEPQNPAEATTRDFDLPYPKGDRKRKRKTKDDDLEDRYLRAYADTDTTQSKKQKRNSDTGVPQDKPSGDKMETGEDAPEESSDDLNAEDEVPVHESLTADADNKASEVEKASRTVFLSNVAVEAISNKAAKKTLLAHLSEGLDKSATPPEKIESIRFRSVAFSDISLPKRAAFITKSLMDATTKSTNAYVVFSTSATARKVVKTLNGTEVLGRHIRVDSVAHPSPTDHRRCVFVGNLGFMDDETVVSKDSDGNSKESKRNKVPSDVEEGLWRTFGKDGRTVENVRVVRDPKTRVGKGIAYVQFYDPNDVESALLLDGKKFPPLLPRALRVTRAKDPRKTAKAVFKSRVKTANANATKTSSTAYRPKATAAEQSLAGRAGKLLGRAGASMQRPLSAARAGARGDADSAGDKMSKIMKSPEDVVFEGRRASSKDTIAGKKTKGNKAKAKGASGKRRSFRPKQGRK